MTEIDKLERWGPIVARCRSARDPDTTYEVRRHPTKRSYSCNCGGYGPRGSCKHTKAAEATEGRSGIVEMGRSGRQIALRQQDAGLLRGALDTMRGKIRDDISAAVTKEAEKMLGAASRPIPIVRAGQLQQRGANKPTKGRGRKASIDEADQIAAESWRIAQSIAASFPGSPMRVSGIAELIEAGIRKFAGTQQEQAPAPVAMAQGQRGVREIILDE